MATRQFVEFSHKGRCDHDPVFFGRWRQIKVVQIKEPSQLGDRCGVVIDPQVDRDVVEPSVAATSADDEKRGRLPPAPVSTGVVAGSEGGQKPVGERLGGVAVPGLLHRFDDVGAGQDVALDRDIVRGSSTRPVEASASGVGGGIARRIDDSDLAVGLAVVVDQPPYGGACVQPASQQIETLSFPGDVGVRLGGKRADARTGSRHQPADGEEFRGNRNAPGFAVR